MNLNEFTAAMQGKVAPATLVTYARDVAAFLAHIAPAPLATLRTADIRGYLAAEMEKGAGNATRARKLTAIAALYAAANLPMPAMQRPRRKRSLPRTLSPADAATLMNEPSSPQERALIALLYGCGLRISEALGLNVADVQGRHDLALPNRSIPLIGAVRTALEAHLAAHPSGSSLTPATPLFLGARGDRLHSRVAQRTIAAFVRSRGLPAHANARTLRQSFTTHMLGNGADVRSLQELLGHHQLATTQRYADLDTTTLQEVWRKAHRTPSLTPAVTPST